MWKARKQVPRLSASLAQNPQVVALVTRAEYEQYWLDLWEKEGHRTQMFSVIVTGPAAAILHGKKKVKGQPQSRGNYVSAAIEFYEKNRRSNRYSEVRRLETQLKRWQTIAHNYQDELRKLQESGN